MMYEKLTVEINGKQHKILHCMGHGQCKCKSCEEKGKYYVSWTDWFYKIDENSPAICYDCLREKLENEQQKDN